MKTKLETFDAISLKTNNPSIHSGDTIKVYQKVKEGDKERIQVFEGLVLATKHGKGVTGTFTVRKISQGIGVERTFPLHSPLIEKIETVKRTKVRGAKLYYLKKAKGKKAKLRTRELGIETTPKEPAESLPDIQAGPPQSSEAGLSGKTE